MSPDPRAEIEKIAYRIYEDRLPKGTPGDDLSDWLQAEQLYRSMPPLPRTLTGQLAQSRGLTSTEMFAHCQQERKKYSEGKRHR